MQLGRAVRSLWGLDPDFLTVNHGSFGATPLSVLAAQSAWRRKLEAQPTRFMAKVLPEALSTATACLAAELGATPNDLVFIENTTSGCNAVLASLDLKQGDQILMLSHAYGAIQKAVEHTAHRAGAGLVRVPVPFPDYDDAALLEGIVTRLGLRTRLAIIDQVTSASALVLPIDHIIACCHDAGVPVLIDGAHAPGMVEINLDQLNADWYVGSCHKWLMAPKGSAFLWARADRQDRLHPTVISHGYGNGLHAEFDWVGTRDPSPMLAVTEALAFYHALGGYRLQRRNALLAQQAASLIADRLGTRRFGPATSIGAMAVAALPIGGEITPSRTNVVQQRLLAAGTDAPVVALAGAAWIRISAQAYNEMHDYVRLSGILASALSG